MWVKFWKRSGTNWTLQEGFKYYPNETSEESFEHDSEEWAERMSGGHEKGFDYGWKVVQHPSIEWLQKSKKNIADEISELHRKRSIYQGTLNKICEKKGHIIKKVITEKGYDTGGASCSVCGEDLGWYCPKNPKQYCEYDDEHDEYCIHCGEPDERK